MEKQDKRPCRVKLSKPLDGHFIQWGTRALYDDASNLIGTETIAIVELNDGRISEALPHLVEFTDVGKQ